AAQANHIPIGQIDPPSGTNTLHPSDSATVLVTFVQKTNQMQWLLYLEATAPDPKEKPEKTTVTLSSSFGEPATFESEPAPAQLRLLGPFAITNTSRPVKSRGKEARISLDKDFLGLGLDQAAALALRWEQMTNSENSQLTARATLAETTNSKDAQPTFKPTPAEQRIIYGQYPALFSYVHTVSQTKGLNDLFFKVVELPSVWSMVRHLGMNFNLSADDSPARANPADWNLPASAEVYYYPWRLQLNGKPALKVTLVVTSPHPPLLICSGVVGVLAEKAGDDETYMTLRVINAHEIGRN
ncbi:MAG TPA: hypothetical protein VN836_07240, partial [Verrucomicrobiae bacterium]|nr:hypothetical protein [Verrucomicrobiae bacterium]